MGMFLTYIHKVLLISASIFLEQRFLQTKSVTWSSVHFLGALPIQQNIPLRISGNFHGEQSSIFWNFNLEHNVRSITKIFENCSPGIPLHCNFSPEFRNLLCKRFAFRKVDNLPIFRLKLSLSFIYHLPSFPNFWNFWLNVIRPM